MLVDFFFFICSKIRIRIPEIKINIKKKNVEHGKN